MITRVWLMFCAVWAGFTMAFGPLYHNPDMDAWRNQWTQALVPLVIGLVLMPILRALNFRRHYREHGSFGVYVWIGMWAFAFTCFIGPSIAEWLGFPRVRDALLWVLAFFCGILPALRFGWWFFVELPFMVLRWLARLLFPQFVDAASRYIRSLLPSQ